MDEKNLTRVERYVLNILESGVAKSDEINKIAHLCNLTDIQVKVAIQLLTHKRLLLKEDVT